MPFTFANVTHTYQNADGTPASGTVEFTLQETLTNGSVTLVASTHVLTQLDASGNINVRLASTQDAGTISRGSDPLWRVDERVIGATLPPWTCSVPSGGVSVDLAQLMPFNTPREAG